MKKISVVLLTTVMLVSCRATKDGAVRQNFSDFGENMKRMSSSYGEDANKAITEKEIKASEYTLIRKNFAQPRDFFKK